MLWSGLFFLTLNATVIAQENKTTFQCLLQQKATVFSFKKLIHYLCKKEFVISTHAGEISLSPENNIYKTNSYLLTQRNYHVNWTAHRTNALSYVLLNKDFFSNYDLLSP